MVARVLRFRIGLLFAFFRKTFGQVLLRVLFGLTGLGAAVALAWMPTIVAGSNPELRDRLDVVVAAGVVFFAFLVPLLWGKNFISVLSFAQFPATGRAIARSVWLTTWCSWPMLAIAAWLIARFVFRPEWVADPLWPVLVSVLVFIESMALSRLGTALVDSLFQSGTAYRVHRLLGWLLLLAILPLMALAVTNLVTASAETLQPLYGVAQWFLGGSAQEALAHAEGAHWVQFGAHVGLSVIVVIAAAIVWDSLSVRRIVKPVPPREERMSVSGLGWFDRFGDRPWEVIAARSLIYWRRDARYVVGVWALPAMAVIIATALIVAGMDWKHAVLWPLPVVLFLIGWSIHNDIAMDSTAIWTHIASGTSGRDDRLGRLIPILIFGLPLATVGSSVLVSIVGRWEIFPAILGMNVAALLVPAGVSSIASVKWPYPSPRPGDSPFVQPNQPGTGSVAAQVFSIIVGLVAVSPAIALGIIAVLHESFSSVMLAFGVGVGLGVLSLWLAVLIGGYLFDRSAPELVKVTEVFD